MTSGFSITKMQRETKTEKYQSVNHIISLRMRLSPVFQPQDNMYFNKISNGEIRSEISLQTAVLFGKTT